MCLRPARFVRTVLEKENWCSNDCVVWQLSIKGTTESDYYLKEEAHFDELEIIWMISHDYVGREVWANHSGEEMVKKYYNDNVTTTYNIDNILWCRIQWKE